MLWMIRWCAMLYSRYAVGRDGLTAYERRRGRKCAIPAVVFGEKVWYKEMRVNRAWEDKFDSEWRAGIWLGHKWESNEASIGTRVVAIRDGSLPR